MTPRRSDRFDTTPPELGDRRGSPYTPHSGAEIDDMLAAIGVDDVEDLFDIPDGVAFDGEFGIPARSEREVERHARALLGKNSALVEFLGRGHYEHFQPAVIDDLSRRSEFLTSYTQYQPEIAQGFLQALFEYQSMFVELTGLGVVNCSIYDAGTALGEAATLAARVRSVTGDRVLIPTNMVEGRRSVLENYVAGTDLSVAAYPMDDGIVDVDALSDHLDDDVAMVYFENPSVTGRIEERVADIAALATEHDALTTMGADPVSLAVLEPPGDCGIDVVIGDAATLGLPASSGTGLGLFATREAYLRQVPGRLVGATTDTDDRRAYTLTLQTREQHIRRERATSNICTNQAWIALRTAMHLAWLGPDGLVDLASTCLREAERLATALDGLDGVAAPVHGGHHIREFVARVADAPALGEELLAAGFAVHVLDEQHIQVCVTEVTAPHADALVDAVAEAIA